MLSLFLSGVRRPPYAVRRPPYAVRRVLRNTFVTRYLEIRKAYRDGTWWREGGWCVLLLIDFSRSSGVIQGHRGQICLKLLRRVVTRYLEIRKAYLDGT